MLRTIVKSDHVPCRARADVETCCPDRKHTLQEFRCACVPQSICRAKVVPIEGLNLHPRKSCRSSAMAGSSSHKTHPTIRAQTCQPCQTKMCRGHHLYHKCKCGLTNFLGERVDQRCRYNCRVLQSPLGATEWVPWLCPSCLAKRQAEQRRQQRRTDRTRTSYWQ